ncbi:unnamed protein product [Arctia plantaginis]|uniref:Endonuclease/exonuclease/phosphatase domain-containing protein n=1 Tax=Arctia plantaginis TaxID=874455 RepID=A0A8S0Z900_ARCPL|nr:unnamed protein product [Arctia plantaginis]
MVLSLNIRSIQHNFDELLITLKRMEIYPDVIILSECWLNENTIIPKMTGYDSFSTNKIINKSGGIAAYVRDVWSTSVHEPLCDECNCLQLIINDKLTILGIYRSPSFKNLSTFLSFIDASLINGYGLLFGLAGDINLDICCNTPTEQCSEYLCLMASHQLLPAITLPTRGEACLDHIFIKDKSLSLGMVCRAAITDHDICLVTMTSESLGKN